MMIPRKIGYDAATGIAYRYGTADASVLEELQSFYSFMEVAGERVLDLGAHIGVVTCWAATHGAAAVRAYEPDPENFRFLQMNVGRFSGVNSKVEIIKAAVLGNDEPQVFLYAHKSWTRTSEHTRYPNVNEDTWMPFSVPAVNFWTVLEEFKPTVIKCDVEGCEYDYFVPFAPITLPDSVWCVAIELHALPMPNGNLDRARGVARSFQDAGFTQTWIAGATNNRPDTLANIYTRPRRHT